MARSVSFDHSHQVGNSSALDWALEPRLSLRPFQQSKDPSSRVSKPSKKTATNQAVKLGTGATTLKKTNEKYDKMRNVGPKGGGA